MGRIETEYDLRIEEVSAEIERLSGRYTYMYALRLASFVGFVALLVLHFNIDSAVVLPLSALCFVLFAFVVRLDVRLSSRLKYLRAKLELNRGEKELINGRYEDRKDGQEYLSIDPFLMGDFDLVGRSSLFQYLNRSTTRLGERLFVERICRAELSKDVIEHRQEAIDELSKMVDFVQDFQIYGGFFGESEQEMKYLDSWIKQTDRALSRMRAVCFVCPAITLLWLLLYLFGTLPIVSISIPILLNLLIVSLLLKHIQRGQSRLDVVIKIVEKYIKLIGLIEGREFGSEYLNQKKSLLKKGAASASSSIKGLFKILSLLDINYNLILFILLNSICGFSVQIYYRLHLWQQRYGIEMFSWFDAISEFDSLMGYATFAHNSDGDTIYPEVVDTELCLEAKGLSHPLIPAAQRVANDLDMLHSPSIVIITGANMAGKSTMLRTIAINLILAMNGSKVVAESFRFSPADILSSIKIQDALSKNESYFYAEISRLKSIIEHVKSHDRTILFLDEILRGTNSKDKQMGSLGLIKKLIDPRAIVFVATHDLIIGNLEQEYPDVAKNYCFEVELLQDSLEFDYKLKRGVSSKLNASILLSRMGLID